jgi:hypothetical protein
MTTHLVCQSLLLDRKLVFNPRFMQPQSISRFVTRIICSTPSTNAVALHNLGARLITADETYYRKAQGAGRFMRLQDYTE